MRAGRLQQAVAGSAVVAAILFLQAVAPSMHPAASFVSLPLLVVVYLSARLGRPVVAMLLGAVIGWFHDGLTGEPIGVYGTVFVCVSCFVSFASVRLKVSVAALMGVCVAAAYVLHELLLWIVRDALLGRPEAFDPELWGALAALHLGLALIFFPLADRLVEKL